MPVAIAAIRCATPVDRAVRAIPLSVMTHLRQNAQWHRQSKELPENPRFLRSAR
jgi:hypothetical protein